MNAITRAKPEGAVAPVSDAESFLAFIANAARDPSVDVSKMERLFEMRERMIDRQAHLEFNAALKKAKADMPAVLKNRYNDQTKSKYANMESVSDGMDPVITDNGFSMSFGTADSPKVDHYRVTCTLAHDGGHEKEYFADIPVDSAGIKGTANKTLTHAFGSTMSYGRRYLKMMIFDVKTTDDDGNAAGGSSPAALPNNTDVDRLVTLVNQHDADLTKLLSAVGCDDIEQITAKQLRDATDKLNAWAKNQPKAAK